jgi:hypothetical protein
MKAPFAVDDVTDDTVGTTPSTTSALLLPREDVDAPPLETRLGESAQEGQAPVGALETHLSGWCDFDLERGRCLLFGGKCLARQKPLMKVIGARCAAVVTAMAIEAGRVGEGCCRDEQQRQG